MNNMCNQNNNSSKYKQNDKSLNIPGVRISFHNAQLITSTGSSTLDFFLGGGLPIGTLCLIEEDIYQTDSKILLSYFLSEGVVNKHSLFLASNIINPETIFKTLPAVKNIEIKPKMMYDKSEDNDLKIAWRYKNIVTSEINLEAHNHSYDLSKIMPQELIKLCNITMWKPSDSEKNTFTDLLQRIESVIEKNGFKTSCKSCNNILRIEIASLGSPLWNIDDKNNISVSIFNFLLMLKMILRTSFAVAMVSVPSTILEDPLLKKRLHQICDFVLSIESFIGLEKNTNPLFKDYNGLLHIKKLPILNTFMYQVPTSDIAFKIKKKSLLIERMHLPPELAALSTEKGLSGCSTLDF